MEGWRLVRVEENPAEIEQAGYHLHLDDESGNLTTDAPLDWSSDDFQTDPPPADPPAPEPELPHKNHFHQDKPAEIVEETPIVANQTPEKPFTPDVAETVSIDELFHEYVKPTEADILVQQQSPDAPQPNPEATAAPELSGGTGKLTSSEFEETKMAIEIFHHGLLNGNAWAMQLLAGEGTIDDYKKYDKEKFDRWAEIGAKLAGKYGVKIPLEALYLMSTGQNLGPGWQLAIQNYRLRKNNTKIAKENEELRWKNWLMQQSTVGTSVNAQAPPPPPPVTYPTTPPPPTGGPLEIKEVNGFVFNSIDGTWTSRINKKKFPAQDGDYIFNPELGIMVHRITGIAKTGRPKGVKDSKPRLRDKNGHFLPREEAEKILAAQPPAES